MAASLIVAGVLTPAVSDVGRLAESPTAHDHAAHDHSKPGDAHSHHEDAEGLKLVAAPDTDHPAVGQGCGRKVAVRDYRVVALAVDITLNRYLDHDPRGRMYALEEDVARVRDEEARNAAARRGEGEPAVSFGLQGDAIQPLTLRVAQGECLRIRLRNDLPADEGVSVHVHGATLKLAGTDRPALARDPASTAQPGQSVVYEWMVDADEPEGTHYFHSHARPRQQSGHGLFGAVIVEPKGTAWSDPRGGGEDATGWDATVTGGDRNFREFVLYYHEVGDETYQVLDRHGAFVPLVDPLTTAYRPGGRALNLRSEPFLNRLSLQQETQGRADESLSYSSYGFGDPATPIMRSYLGDPVVQRVVHAGPEVFHVHHTHGGGVRWRRQSSAIRVSDQRELDKRPAILPGTAERTDSQSIGPSETFDVVSECGSGGCQQSVGDLMFHCHVSHHYFAGMWGLWRVYNTRQDGPASTDLLSPLAELGDREGRTHPAVESSALVGRTVDSHGRRDTITADGLAAWVERQLPPPGVPRGYDASVYDWVREGDVYQGEPETEAVWPGYRARAPGQRPPLLFDPLTGKLAYPFLRPHLGKRPPFAPGHGPAPFLDPVRTGPDPPAPGANGPGSVCPEGTRAKLLAINAVNVSVPINARAGLIDQAGQLFVLRQQRDEVMANPALRTPLVVRANASEDCVDVLLRSELPDGLDDPFSKISAHVHFMQFDVQGSDGVNAGFNYEQTVRPFRAEGEVVAAPAPAGATTVRLTNADRFQAGAVVGVGTDRDAEFEALRIQSVDGDTVTFDEPLAHPHGAGEIVSAEFVRYRWYPDTQFGTAFLHDHVRVIPSSRHGLFGAILSEPPGSTYHDPHTGAPLVSGPIADIHTSAPLSHDVGGSFRELVSLIQDDNPLTAEGRSSGSSLNLRAEPLDARGRDPSRYFSSAEHGDPVTPLAEAYLGDPLVVRALVGASNDVHSWHLDGHWFRGEPNNSRSPPINTVDVGISERFDLSVARAGGPQSMPGDYLYYNGRAFKLQEGSWGLLRVHDGSHTGLRRLPGHESVPAPAASVCPPDAPRKRYDVAAVTAPLPMLRGRVGKVYVLQDEKEAVQSGQHRPDPLVLRVNVGDCINVALANDTGEGAVSFHADLLAFDPRSSGGVDAGNNPPQTVAPGSRRDYTFYASPEVGETTALVRDWGDVTRNPGLGLYGAIVVGPPGSTYRDPSTGVDVSNRSSWRVDVHPPEAPPYRDFTLLFQDEDANIGTHRMPYTDKVAGTVGVNYRAAQPELTADPPTPVMEAIAGDPVKVHVVAPWSEQAQVFSVEGHRWPRVPDEPGADVTSSVVLGGLEALNLQIEGGAGGEAALAGDYLYGNHREPYRLAGQWGRFRVHPCGTDVAGLRSLGTDCPSDGGGRGFLMTTALAAGSALVLGGALFLSRRRSSRLGA